MKANITTIDLKTLTLEQDAFNPDLVSLSFNGCKCTVLLSDLDNSVSTIVRIKNFTK